MNVPGVSGAVICAAMGILACGAAAEEMASDLQAARAQSRSTLKPLCLYVYDSR